MKEQKYLKIIGKQKLNGVIKASGSKNASLPIIAASLLIKGKVKLNNVPRIKDVFSMLKILEYLNVDYIFNDNELIIDSTNMLKKDLTIEEVKKFRAAYYLLPIIIEEKRKVKFINVGGCNFENRPIDLHLDILKCIGGSIEYKNDTYSFYIEKFKKLKYEFNRSSLGATINAILFGLVTKKEVIIQNYSKEPEVECLLSFLSKAGLEIEKKENSISFHLKTQLNSLEFEIMPDRIEAETFALLGMSLGRIGIFDFVEEHHKAFIDFLNYNCVVYTLENNFLLINETQIDKSNNILLKEYPGLSTDIGPILLSSLLLGEKMFLFEDKVYPTRLSKLFFFGSCFYFNKEKLLINPLRLENKNNVFYGSNLRDSMAYLFYCLTHEGEFELYGLEHLFRGYENIIDKLISLNAKVELIDED